MVHGTQTFSENPIKSSHMELDVTGVDTRKSGWFSLISSLQAFGLSTTVKQWRNEKEYLPAEISCLPDRLEVVETQSMEANVCTSVP